MEGFHFSDIFQSTRPVWGATRRSVVVSTTDPHFNPRAPCGARPESVAIRSPATRISIHAPRVGRDELAGVAKYNQSTFQSTRPVWGDRPRCGQSIGFDSISIHAPRVGRDSMRSVGSIFSYYFNPRAPCGARPVLTGTGYKNKSISIHAPRVGRDCPGRSRLCRTRYFNPRAPCGARRSLQAALPARCQISIHAPRVGRDGRCSNLFIFF